MPTLLILGSKPDPALPPAASFDAVACANASGYSADRHGLPVPALTAISAVLTSGIGSGKQSLEALRGLRTEALYRVPQFDKPRKTVEENKNPAGRHQDLAGFFQVPTQTGGLPLEQLHQPRRGLLPGVDRYAVPE